MNTPDLKKSWKNHYAVAPSSIDKMSQVDGVISAYNSNIDAVLKITPKLIEDLCSELKLSYEAITNITYSKIRTKEDVLKAIVKCFTSGIAEEWLVEEVGVFKWLQERIGYDRLQMGGQAGIVANAMAVCGAENVYVHCASLPKLQAELFLDLPNLKSCDEKGQIQKAHNIDRKTDLPLIHWILEFDVDAEININGHKIKCPKSNRFIATYDPLNFELYTDSYFNKQAHDLSHDYIILSGYHMLTEKLPNGKSSAEIIDNSLELLKGWKKGTRDCVIHLEVASTQDKVVRKQIIEKIAPKMDSMGLNERETIDVLEVIGQESLAQKCDKETTSANLFDGIIALKEKTKCPRIQLHMFGLYLTVQDKGYKISAKANRNGMITAAVVSAGKAGTGAINDKKALLWAKDMEVADKSLEELERLASHVKSIYGENALMSEGIYSTDKYDIIAVPTILVPKPLTLVGMGDTISSVSLVASR